MSYTRKKQLTTPIISMNHVEVAYLKITGLSSKLMVESLVNKDGEYPDTYPCINLDTGEECQLLAGVVIKGAFDAYGADLVGKGFELLPQPRIEGKKYLPIKIWEIESKECN